MYTRNLLIAIFSFLALAACSPKPSESTENSDNETEVNANIEKAKAEVIEGFKNVGDSITKVAFEHLSTKLKSVIDTGGFARAVDFCSVEALPLTKQVADKYNVKIQRIATKYRNPFNMARDNDLAVIEGFANNKAPVVIESENAYTYYKPIGTMAVCLNCHGKAGETLNELAYQTIIAKYPEDKAIGFNEGDLRGAWKITFEK